MISINPSMVYLFTECDHDNCESCLSRNHIIEHNEDWTKTGQCGSCNEGYSLEDRGSDRVCSSGEHMESSRILTQNPSRF